MSTNAFSPPVAIPRNVQKSTTARNILLTNEETDAILTSAHDCAEGECSIDDVSELIFELKDQQKEMNSRLEEIMNMVSHLQELNKGEERVTDDVRAYVKDLLRVFDSNTGGWATGFTGDIGDGPTTAYDALDPKPWKASKK
eukprot:CAMPEP_0197823572 /NCGR_PEP_ID=MMETSP1437-20131217/896_1 /TAXON_ID=49252 ORGANISM="Eucampia antarctica, Strain CCMP1452" /NCGR_SAMPLE_ID=MMETSP1437 /ASSEMBLY_ACC=CAM_ASM_001096 /LENGTH=141 /DNA_ID=CAMNT_0043422803 /DNA_START=216 /DNA_END=641 /DNA_ORIENTATION=+